MYIELVKFDPAKVSCYTTYIHCVIMTSLACSYRLRGEIWSFTKSMAYTAMCVICYVCTVCFVMCIHNYVLHMSTLIMCVYIHVASLALWKFADFMSIPLQMFCTCMLYRHSLITCLLLSRTRSRSPRFATRQTWPIHHLV